MQLTAFRMVQGRLAADKMQKVLKQKILKGCLEGNIRIGCDNVKMYLKETSFDLTINSYTTSQG